MVSKATAFRQLSIAFNQWARATDPHTHYFGVVMVMLSWDGVALQYLGEEPVSDEKAAAIMQIVAEKMAAGEYSIDDRAAVKFDGLN